MLYPQLFLIPRNQSVEVVVSVYKVIVQDLSYNLFSQLCTSSVQEPFSFSLFSQPKPSSSITIEAYYRQASTPCLLVNGVSFLLQSKSSRIIESRHRYLVSFLIKCIVILHVSQTRKRS